MKLIHVKLFFIFSLFWGGTMHAKISDSPSYLGYVKEITSSFAKETEKQFDLLCIGSGGGMPHNVEDISIAFIAYRKGTIKEAREIEVKATEKLLVEINANKKIQPFLIEYPFKANRAEVSVSFRQKDDSCYKDGSVVHVFQTKNKVFYYAEDPLSGKRVLLLEEPYEEARKLVLGS